MSNKLITPITTQNEITGSYLGCNRGFSSGRWVPGDDQDYARALKHLITVLENIPETGSSTWGHKGVRVEKWVHDGITFAPQQFETLENFQDFLTQNNITISEYLL